MSFGSGLLALAMITAEAPASPVASCDESPSFQLKVITVDGLSWRSTAYPRLKPVARQGTATIWTADRGLAQTLEAAAVPGESASARSNLQGVPSEGSSKQVRYVSHMTRVADGPINEATAVAFVPEVATVEEGVKAKIDGRKLDQGILTRISLEDVHVEAMHVVGMSESVKPLDKKDPYANYTRRRPGRYPSDIDMTTDPKTTPVNFVTQVPEVSKSTVNGEWLIPDDGVLLMSLGVHTFADAKGMAVVRERLVILQVQPKSIPLMGSMTKGNINYPEYVVNAGYEPTPIGISRVENDSIQDTAPTSVAEVRARPMSFPPLPARSTPSAFDQSGKVVDLPPLPEGLASSDLDQIKPEPNQPSPQSRMARAASSDPQLARTGFATESPTKLPVFENEATDVPLPPSKLIRSMLDSLAATVAYTGVRALPPSKLIRSMLDSGIFDNAEIQIDEDALVIRVTPNHVLQKNPTTSDEPCEDAEVTPSSSMLKSKSTIEPHCDNSHDLVKTRATGVFGVIESLLTRMGVEIEVERVYRNDPEPKKIEIGIEVKNFVGYTLQATELDLTRALRTPGKTESTTVPVSDNLALEIKATVVPIPAEPAKP